MVLGTAWLARKKSRAAGHRFCLPISSAALLHRERCTVFFSVHKQDGQDVYHNDGGNPHDSGHTGLAFISLGSTHI